MLKEFSWLYYLLRDDHSSVRCDPFCNLMSPGLVLQAAKQKALVKNRSDEQIVFKDGPNTGA